MRRWLLFVLLTVCAAQAELVMNREGRLTAQMPKLERGEHIETLKLRCSAGQVVTLRLESEQFDPFLIAQTPDGRHFENDDYGGGFDAQLTFVNLVDGEVGIGVTSASAGETGAYLLRGAAVSLANGVHGLTPAVQSVDGELTDDDNKLVGGESVDIFAVKVKPGDLVRAVMTSNALDAYLILRPGDEPVIEADDVDGTNCEVSYVARSAGTVIVLATSAKAGEHGAYHFELQLGPTTGRMEGLAPDLPVVAAQGELNKDCQKLESGHYLVARDFAAAAGETVHVRLDTEGFAGRLLLVPPTGDPVEVVGQVGQPIEARLPCIKAGLVKIVVTSDKPGETGPFLLRVLPVEHGEG